MSDTYWAIDLAKRLAQAEQYVLLIETNRPDDHQSIHRARQYVRRLKKQLIEGASTK